LFVKFDGRRRGYKYPQYLTTGLDQVVENPDVTKYPFILELQQIDRYTLSSCALKRFRMVKKPINMAVFDVLVGDEVFLGDSTCDTLTQQLIRGGQDADTALTVRGAAAKSAVAAHDSPVEIGDIVVRDVVMGVQLTRKRSGRIFDYFETITATTKELSKAQVDVVVPRKVVNKVALNFVNAPELNTQLIKSNLTYINNNVPEIDLVEDGIPVLCYAIKETAVLETFLSANLKSKDSELISALKKDAFDITATGVKDAFKKGKLWAYISRKIRGLFGLNVDKVVENSNSRLDFH
jgi:hypothetical protein